jgi:hypothetical protein
MPPAGAFALCLQPLRAAVPLQRCRVADEQRNFFVVLVILVFFATCFILPYRFSKIIEAQRFFFASDRKLIRNGKFSQA